VFQKAMRVFKKMLTVAAMATVLKLVGAASIDPDSFDQELEDMKEFVQILTKTGDAITAMGEELESIADSTLLSADKLLIKKALGVDGFKKAEEAIKNMKSGRFSGVAEFMKIADDEEKVEKIEEALGVRDSGLEIFGQVFYEFNEEMDELFPDFQQESNFAVAQTAPSVAATVLLTTTAVWAFA